jgi:Histidine kinase-, DNA gyrase B-, and HSP90-like ATPase
MTSTRKGRRLLSGKQTVFSIRDTGYKSTDYAVAELIDNSIQAEADTVLVVLVTEPKTGGQRAVENVAEIVVIDDGTGMPEQLLFDCLAFGESGRFDDRSGIGRFGMGLSQASVSQGRRVDVWSFQQTRPCEAGHVYLDLDEIEASSGSELDVLEPTVPGDPDHEPLPEWIDPLYAVAGMGTEKKDGVDVRSGTIVRWSKLDRLRWVRASAIRSHTELTLGRIYRRFLTDGFSARRVHLRLAIVSRAALDKEKAAALEFTEMRPTDPLFLLRPVDSTLVYWERAPVPGEKAAGLVRVHNVPMSRPFPAGHGTLPDAVTDPPDTPALHADARRFPVKARPDSANSGLKGKSFDVEVRASMARIDAQPGRNPGRDTHQGRIARDQAGISIMRANRELCIEGTLAAEATDRWWGLEVSFGAELDEVFGVTNNKQDVPYFTQALRMCREQPGVSVQKAIEQGFFDEAHPISDLWAVAQYVLAQRNSMAAERKADKSTSDKSNTKKQPGVVAGVSRQKVIHPEILPPSESAKKFEEAHPDQAQQSELIREELRAKHGNHLTNEQIDAIVELRDANFVVQVHEKFVPETDAVFWPEETGNLNIAWINTAHPAHERLLTPLRVTDDKLRAMSIEELRALAAMGADAVGMLILMWCEMEIDDPNGRHTLKQARERWGSFIKSILADTDITIGEDLLATFDDDDDD